jgi:DNA polymerase-4
MDCFYAAVEMRDDPSLRGRPIAVGGSPERRGVLTTCNYEARRYGLHSAMASAQAVRRCPDLLILPVDMEKYRAASRRIHAILRRYTERIEPLSLDEAYLDVTGSPTCDGSATRIAERIRAEIRARESLTASAGVAPNKFLAKVASDWDKPDGLYVIPPDEVAAFVARLPVARIPGVGPVTARRLAELGLHHCADLQAQAPGELARRFGRFGQTLHALAHGLDPRPVQSQRLRKSLSVERTYPRDLPDLAACLAQLPALLEELRARLAGAEAHGPARAAFVKLKFNDFTQTTAQMPAHSAELAELEGLVETAWGRAQRPVRLLGLGLQFTDPPTQAAQLALGLSEEQGLGKEAAPPER